MLRILSATSFVVISILVPVARAAENRFPSVQVPCTYECSYEFEGYAYLMRTDGVLVRFNMTDQTILEYPNAAPAGRYVAMFRNPTNPLLSGLMAVRDDGLVAYLPWTSLNDQWQVLTTLPNCNPVATTSTTLGGVKAQYKK